METLVGVLLRCLSTHAINACSLPVVDSCLADTLNCSVQVLMERARDRASNVVS